MDLNNTNRAPVAEVRPPSAAPPPPAAIEPPVPSPLPPRPQLTRADSQSGFVQQAPRPQGPPGPPPQPQQRPLQPQFQPGGPVTGLPQFAPRPSTPTPRGPAPPPGTQPLRQQQPPLRQYAPQSFAPQQAPRPAQIPTSGQIPPRVPPPNNLQFGPRQPPQFGGGSTQDGLRPPLVQQTNGLPRNGAPIGVQQTHAQLPRQPSQGALRSPDLSNTYQNKPVNLDNQANSNDNQNVIKTENGSEVGGIAKGRSYSIAASPGAPSPLKTDDDRRKSVSSIGGKLDEFSSRSPGLGLIQEGKIDIRGSRESIRSEASNDGRDLPERPESRLSSSKMTDSFIGSLPQTVPKQKFDDNDDVILHSNIMPMKPTNKVPQNQSKTEIYDRSPSLTRSDDSPENKISSNTIIPNRPQNIQEPPRPKTPKAEIKPDLKSIDVKEYKPNALSNKAETRPLNQENKPPVPVQKKPSELNTTNISVEQSKKSTPRKSTSAVKPRQKDGDNDSGVDESTQGNDLNGSPGSPNKKLPSKLPTKEKSSNSIRMSLSRSSSKSATAKTPDPLPAEKKKVPMNKIQVGNAPSPNIKAVKSKIGSLDNTTYKPGGGKVKIENRKLEFGSVTPRIAAKNDKYVPSGGSKKITTTKLEWKAESKIGSLQNTAYKPGGGDKKIETVKLDFKDKAKPKVASTVNITHKPGGGVVKIENQKLEFKAQSKVGSLDNVKYKPGGGEIKIFDDKEYLKQMGGQSPVPGGHTDSRQESPLPPKSAEPPKSDVNLNQQQF